LFGELVFGELFVIELIFGGLVFFMILHSGDMTASEIDKFYLKTVAN